MLNMQENTKMEIADLDKIAEEYKSKILLALELEREKYLALAKQESEDVIKCARTEAENTIAEGKEKVQQIVNETESHAREEAAKIILDARNNAEQIVSEASDRAKKEAESIVIEARRHGQEIVDDAEDRAKNEAKERKKKAIERIIDDARREAEKQSAKTITSSKIEAEQIINKAREAARAEASSESLKIITDARHTASSIREHSIASVNDTHELMTELLQDAAKTIEKLKIEAVTYLEGLVSRIAKIAENLKNSSTTDEICRDWATKDYGTEAKEQWFNGEKQIQIASSFNKANMDEFMESLQHIPYTMVNGQSGSPSSSIIYLDIKEPIPLLTFLRAIPSVRNADSNGDVIKLKLGPSKKVTNIDEKAEVGN